MRLAWHTADTEQPGGARQRRRDRRSARVRGALDCGFAAGGVRMNLIEPQSRQSTAKTYLGV